MSTAPFSVPNDDLTPWPVDFTRLISALHDMDYAVDILVPDKAAGAVFDRIPFLFSVDTNGRFFSIRALWETGIRPHEVGPWVFAASDSWNREKYFPTIYWMTSEDDTVHICADFTVNTSAGLSNIQLKENVNAGLSTGISAIQYMQHAADHTLSLPDVTDDGALTGE
ncbi:YbjN domain-containing protein [Schaalia sp. lx-100]|uniref:YbjN domain-containing protein n=1 Tax=Schaalia sp. lx-100 TaxID=2899081 RepID=UPI001E2CEF25|nr:YbjN domain-containing protein [Schaalia sp. lx-100]MCD4557456.1 YbjN domain-containing protein [Schaalia sp. lx-100]